MPTPTSILDRGIPRLPLLAALQPLVALRIANQVRSLTSRASMSSVPALVQGYRAVYDAVWTPADQFLDGAGATHTMTPQQVCDGLGTDAASLFALAAGYTPALLTLAPNSVPAGIPAGKVVTPHEDGTVTISDAA